MYDLYLVLSRTLHGRFYTTLTTDPLTVSDRYDTAGPALVGPGGYHTDEEARTALADVLYARLVPLVPCEDIEDTRALEEALYPQDPEVTPETFALSWRERVVAAETAGFTKADRKDAIDFDTCAVGEQRNLFPDAVKYQQNGELVCPRDLKLRILGSKFCLAVVQDDCTKAHALLDQIEARVRQLRSRSLSPRPLSPAAVGGKSRWRRGENK